LKQKWGCRMKTVVKFSKKGRGRPRKYPWDKWFAHQRFTLRKGVDYVCGSGAMIMQVRDAAQDRRLRTTVVEHDDGFTVIVRGRMEPRS
jgi:hypothetical protein